MTYTLRNMPNTFDEIERILINNRGDVRTIANNTTAQWEGDNLILIRLHGHGICDLYRDGLVTVRDCGYMSHTTKDRLNRFLRSVGAGVVQRDWAWYVMLRNQEYGLPNEPYWNPALIPWSHKDEWTFAPFGMIYEGGESV